MTIEKASRERQTIHIRTQGTRMLLLVLALCLLVPPSAFAAEPQAAAGEATSAETAAAQEIYRTRCVLCHGETGKGDGPGGMVLDPRPRDLGDPAWQTAVTDEYIERIIARGGVAVGKSPSMPPNPDLRDKPETVRALRQLVRSFARK